MTRIKVFSLGDWTFSEADRLGGGGNGVVYRATHSGGAVGALKRLRRNPSSEQIARFKDEISAMLACREVEGVLALLDSYTPANGSSDPPWFVMELAESFLPALGSKPSLKSAVQAVCGIAGTLAKVHGLGFSHRDVKPENLFRREGRWSTGDFGLADFEGKAAKTRVGERVGPILYIAPEMLNGANTADGKKADVFSLAKVLWVAATGQRFPLPGSYDQSIDAFRIGSYVIEDRTTQLDALIAVATAFDPAQRPTMARMAEDLSAWLHPPSPAPTPIALNFGGKEAQLADRKAELEAAISRETRRTELEREIGRRIRERFRKLALEIWKSLTPANCSQLDVAIDNIEFGVKVHAIQRRGSNQIVEFEVAINVDSWSLPELTLEGRIDVREAGAITSLHRVWHRKPTFLQGGATEDAVTAMLETEARENLQAGIDKFLALALAHS